MIKLLVPTSLGSMCLWPEDSQHFPPWVGFLAPAEQLKICIRFAIYIPSGGTKNMRLYCSNHQLLELALWNLGISRRLKLFFKKTNEQETGDSKRLLYLLNPAWFQCPVFLDTPQSWGQQGQDNKGNKVLDREVHQKPRRGTWFLEELVSTSWNLTTVIQSYSNVSNI